MTALICGSIAYDNIMVFHDYFKNHILPDKIHILNVSFLVPDMRREFGGCAGNIAYNLKLLKENGIPMGTVGTDFDTYAEWMQKHGISTDCIKVIDDTLTGQCYITTDLDDNQITAFHPGAMNMSQDIKVSDANGVSLGIVSPDGREGMIQHAEQFAEAGIPFIFDPGQGMPLFDSEDLNRFIELASYATFNDYEWQLMQDRTGLSERDVAERVNAVIITKGGMGSTIHTKDTEYQIPVATTTTIEDPTGCGDAFRAGLLFGLMNELDWETTGRIASLMGAIKIENKGTQNHVFSMSEFETRFKETFAREL